MGGGYARGTRALTGGGAVQGFGNLDHVGNHSLDAVAAAFNLGNQLGHLVAVKGVVDLAVGGEKWGWGGVRKGDKARGVETGGGWRAKSAARTG